MPTSDVQKEIIKMVTISNNEELLPDTRLNAARRLLRFTNFSSRSVRVAKRTAKQYFNDENASTDVRRKAASLLEFVLSKPADDGTPLEPLTTVVVSEPGAPKVRTLEDYNCGWDALPVPKKFIAFYEPADLPAYGLPASPDFTWSPERALETVEWTDGDGTKYYVKYAPAKGFHNLILNPKYVAAFKAWKNSPRVPVDPRLKYQWDSVFEYEDHFSAATRGGCPVQLLWTPNQSFPKPGVANGSSS